MPRKRRKKKRQKRAMRLRKNGCQYAQEDMFTPEGVLITTPLEIGMKGNQESNHAGYAQKTINQAK